MVGFVTTNANGTTEVQIGASQTLLDSQGRPTTIAAQVQGAVSGVNLIVSLANAMENWNQASDLSHVQTVVNIYNQINSLASMSMPGLVGLGAILNFASAEVAVYS